MKMTGKRVLFVLTFILMFGLVLQQCWQSRSPADKWLYFFGDAGRDYAGVALGADRGIQVATDGPVEPLVVAKLLKGVVDKEQPQLVSLGKQSIDGDNNQTGQMLGALANMPQGTFASEISVDGDKLNVTREVDGGLQTLSLSLPAVVTTDLRLNEPRYASLPNIMKAKKKQLDVYTPGDLGVSVTTHLTQVKVEPPAERKAGITVADVDQLVDKLKNEAKVI